MKKIGSYLFLIYIVFTGTISCNKSNNSPTVPNSPSNDSTAEIISYSIVGMDSKVSISPSWISVRFPDTVLSGADFAASFTLSPGAKAFLNGSLQTSGASKSNFESSLDYTVKAANGASKHWFVNSTNNDYSINWGLGNFVKKR